MSISEYNEHQIDDLADQLKEFSHSQVSALGDMLHKLPQSYSDAEAPQEKEEVNDRVLAQIFANHDYLVALAGAGFAPPDSPAGKRELLQAFLEAIERTSILPHHIASEVARLRLQTAETETFLSLEEASRRSKIEVATIQGAQALEVARTEKKVSDAHQSKRRNDAAYMESHEQGIREQLENRERLDRNKAAYRQLTDEQNAELEQRKSEVDFASRSQQVRIQERKQKRKDNLEIILPKWIADPLLKKS